MRKTFVGSFALGCLALCCASPALHAQSSLSCFDNAGNVAMELPVTSVYFDVPYGQQRFYTITTPLSELNYVLQHEYPTQTFYYCDFSPSVGTFGYFATIADTSATVDAASQYVSVTFNYTLLQLGPDAKSKTPPANTLTADQKTRALADYLAHVPKPSLAQQPQAKQ